MHQASSLLSSRGATLLRWRALALARRHAAHHHSTTCGLQGVALCSLSGYEPSPNASRSTLESELTAAGRSIAFTDPPCDQPKEPSKEETHQLQQRLG